MSPVGVTKKEGLKRLSFLHLGRLPSAWRPFFCLDSGSLHGLLHYCKISAKPTSGTDHSIKTTRAGRSIPSCPCFIWPGDFRRLFRSGSGLVPAGPGRQPARRMPQLRVRRPTVRRCYSRKWFCSLQVSANSRSARRWWRIISATPSSSCSRTRRSSSRCSKKTSSCGTVQTR